MIAVKIVQGILANSILEKKYSEWLSDNLFSQVCRRKITSTVVFLPLL